MKNQFFKLMLITDKKDKDIDEYLKFIALAAKSGITSVQLREKHLAYPELLKFGQALQKILKPYNIPLIINDNIELALALNAAGVHLGQTDGDIIQARKYLSKNKIIGLTIDSIDQLKIANTLPVDYLGIGAIFPSLSKPDIATVWGLDNLKQIRKLTTHRLIAIGGINEINALKVMQAGADGIAAIQSLHESKNPPTTIKNLRHIVEG